MDISWPPRITSAHFQEKDSTSVGVYLGRLAFALRLISTSVTYIRLATP